MPGTPRYDSIAISLHWLTVLAIVALLALGWTMVDQRPGSALQFQLYQLHKSVGFTVLALTALRLAWRWHHRPPPLPAAMPDWEQRAAMLGHLGLYALLVCLPLSGWALVSTAPFNIPTRLYGLVPVPHLAFLADSPDKAAAHHLFETLHGGGIWVLLGLLAVHIGAALRHHFVQGDDVLRRMLPRFIRLCAAVAAAAAMGWPGGAGAAEWTIDPAASRLGFVGSQGGSRFEGSFARWHGSIVFDPAQPAAGHALITIDMASATTGESDKDQLLPQPEWFSVAEFPQAVFEANSFRAKGGNAYDAVGTLTIRGISRKVVLPFTLDLAGDGAHAKGGLDLIRSDFGVGQGSWSNPQMVALEVAVVFELSAHQRH